DYMLTPDFIAFPKKKVSGYEKKYALDGEMRKVPIYVQNWPPSFYEKLRNRKTIKALDVRREKELFNYDKPRMDSVLKNTYHDFPASDEIDEAAAELELERIAIKNADRGIV
ncbi:MAG: hypothetical protein ACREOP_15535, partial [Thermodesulfobacteriota bacterium]